MKKWFITSDIHSFYTPFENALNEAGFDKDNPDHTLIICGDVFDRGYESQLLFKFLTSLNQDRLILIKGNHESLFLEAVKRWENYHKKELNNSLTEDEKGYPFLFQNDLHNGTLRTIADFAYMFEEELYTFEGQYEALKRIHNSPVVKWLKSKKWLNYYELDKYIFVHSFIPLHNKTGCSIYNANFNRELFKYFKNWRDKATKKEWEDSRWGCPWKQYRVGLFDEEAENGKILVCGHWHTADFYQHLNDMPFDPTYDSPIYVGKNIIGLDACTAMTYKVNVLVIDENFNCWDKTGTPASEIKKENHPMSVIETVTLENSKKH